MGPNTISRLLLISVVLMFLVKSITCQSRDSDAKSRAYYPVPCLCRNRYFRYCPGSCRGRSTLMTREPNLVLSSKSRISEKPFHFEHPDHLDESEDISESVGGDQKYDENVGDSRSGGETIVRHRKVYLSDRADRVEPTIHAIDLTIPVKVNNEPIDNLPPPKPMYRMHKYTTIETKPQVEMMPVTTTIIKPVGVSKDQIIEDE